jgi:hypothetical protein
MLESCLACSPAQVRPDVEAKAPHPRIRIESMQYHTHDRAMPVGGTTHRWCIFRLQVRSTKTKRGRHIPHVVRSHRAPRLFPEGALRKRFEEYCGLDLPTLVFHPDPQCLEPGTLRRLLHRRFRLPAANLPYENSTFCGGARQRISASIWLWARQFGAPVAKRRFGKNRQSSEK